MVRSTVWGALFLYTAAELGRLRWRRGRSDSSTVSRWFSTGGLVFFLVHVLSAFAVFHDWSHERAYRFTAAETERLMGWQWGGGLFVNYGFTLVWLGEVAAWWRAEEAYRLRPLWIDGAVRFFFGFMIVNGAVVFVEGPQKWLGVAVLLVLGSAGVSRQPSVTTDERES